MHDYTAPRSARILRPLAQRGPEAAAAGHHLHTYSPYVRVLVCHRQAYRACCRS